MNLLDELLELLPLARQEGSGPLVAPCHVYIVGRHGGKILGGRSVSLVLARGEPL